MKNGNISEFLKRDGQFNRRPLVRPDNNPVVDPPKV